MSDYTTDEHRIVVTRNLHRGGSVRITNRHGILSLRGNSRGRFRNPGGHWVAVVYKNSVCAVTKSCTPDLPWDRVRLTGANARDAAREFVADVPSGWTVDGPHGYPTTTVDLNAIREAVELLWFRFGPLRVDWRATECVPNTSWPCTWPLRPISEPPWTAPPDVQTEHGTSDDEWEGFEQ